MSETNDVNDAIKHFPRLRARTLRFGCGAPRSAQTVGDGSRALFLRSDGPEDLVTALWLSWFDESGEHHETKLADPRELLGATADSEDVPAEEKARRAGEGSTEVLAQLHKVPAASVRAKAAPASSDTPQMTTAIASCSPSTAACS